RLVKGTEHELPAEEMILAILTMRNTALLKWTEENPYGAIKSIDVSALAFATRIHRERLKALEEESGVRGAEYGVEDRGQGSGVGDQKEKKAGTDVIPASRLRESATAEQAAGMTQAPDEASSPDSSAISATSVDESSSPPSRRCAVA
ncbi:MAG: hypothetical protein L6Q71_07215, partial [Planctomycetes bacterium]|nr:hypothetical protein [Planctomycetota bacterium]